MILQAETTNTFNFAYSTGMQIIVIKKHGSTSSLTKLNSRRRKACIRCVIVMAGWHSYSHVTKFRHKVFVFLCTAITLIVWSRSWRIDMVVYPLRCFGSGNARRRVWFLYLIWYYISVYNDNKYEYHVS
jgi:hypothetical protein